MPSSGLADGDEFGFFNGRGEGMNVATWPIEY
jgi:hypothetical protein